jgi:hypothetical protein
MIFHHLFHHVHLHLSQGEHCALFHVLPLLSPGVGGKQFFSISFSQLKSTQPLVPLLNTQKFREYLWENLKNSPFHNAASASLIVVSFLPFFRTSSRRASSESDSGAISRYYKENINIDKI